MQWHTELHITEKIPFLTHAHKIFTLGSCFAEAMGKKLAENKWQVAINPFGTIYNPLAIFRILRFCGGTEVPQKKFCVQNPEKIWLHYDFHSLLRAETQEILWENIRQKTTEMARFFAKNPVLILTLGTAWVYEIENHSVANCHKMPASCFQKRLLSVEEILQDFEYTYPILQEKIIIFTVSPVRHLKDTLPLNSVSKAVLRLACHYLQAKYVNVYYFPAFELVIDDLRDYRFYTDDLLHITPQAENYIWQKFQESYLPTETQKIVESWSKIQRKLQHKPFNPTSEAHQNFLKNLLQELQDMQKYFDVSQEIQEVRSQIQNFS
ncbi:MAG: GSCFA domain-containing protein [Raineya sp.]|nr:GSCFA domain-containing protein [Raineya sp.]MDW8296790.1 GSCFA domain-containing protein [Raineya sp.]